MDILQGPTFWFWIWKHCEFQILLFHWVLNPIFLDLDRAAIQCHVRRNLPSFKQLVITKVIWTHSFIISGAILFLTLNISVARACIFLWWIETELSFSTGLEMKMSYHCKLFLTLFHRNNLFYCYDLCYETSRLKDSTQIEVLQMFS